MCAVGGGRGGGGGFWEDVRGNEQDEGRRKDTGKIQQEENQLRSVTVRGEGKKEA